MTEKEFINFLSNNSDKEKHYVKLTDIDVYS